MGNLTDKRKIFVTDALNKMFEICGSTMKYEDAVEASKNRSEWYLENEWNSDQREVWKKWFVTEVMKRKIVPSLQHANREFDWFDLAYGPKLNDTQLYETSSQPGDPDQHDSNGVV